MAGSSEDVKAPGRLARICRIARTGQQDSKSVSQRPKQPTTNSNRPAKRSYTGIIDLTIDDDKQERPPKRARYFATCELDKGDHEMPGESMTDSKTFRELQQLATDPLRVVIALSYKTTSDVYGVVTAEAAPNDSQVIFRLFDRDLNSTDLSPGSKSVVVQLEEITGRGGRFIGCYKNAHSNRSVQMRMKRDVYRLRDGHDPQNVIGRVG